MNASNHPTVTLHLHRQIASLKKQATLLGALVEEQFENALNALDTRNIELAQKVIAIDKDVDAKEIELEEECLKIMALYQPYAQDMRFIISILKITNDLERIGDLARDIAKIVIASNDHFAERVIDFNPLVRKVQWMVRRSLDSMIDLDAQIAREVSNSDDEVDQYFDTIKEQIINKLEQDNSNVRGLLSELMISDYMESIADHAKKIAEDVVYTVEAEVIRHKELG
jgi:phosphate transport system protein